MVFDIETVRQVREWPGYSKYKYATLLSSSGKNTEWRNHSSPSTRPRSACQIIMRSAILSLSLVVGLSSQAAVTLRETDTTGILKFREDGTFHVSVFSDTHLAMCAWHPGCLLQDKKGVKVIESVLDAEKPDFAVFNGDLINADSAFKHNASHYVDQLVKPLVDRGLSWGSTYGNHDHQTQLAGETLLAREKTFPGARTSSMVQGDVGTTNYYLPVYPAGCKNAKDIRKCAPELILWFFDSRGGRRYQEVGNKAVSNPNWVDTKVVEWFQQTTAEMRSKYQKVIPSVGFTHIPPYAMVKLQEKGVDKNRQPGINDESASPQAQGWCIDNTDGNPDCKYGLQDVPFMNAIVNTEGFMGLFSGHDHANSWCHKWNEKLPGMNVKGRGVHLCFGQHTGYGGYGNWIRGSRELLFSKEDLKKFELNSHIRLESGAIVGDISLNSTYGEDMYPETPNDKTYLYQ